MVLIVFYYKKNLQETKIKENFDSGQNNLFAYPLGKQSIKNKFPI